MAGKMKKQTETERGKELGAGCWWGASEGGGVSEGWSEGNREDKGRVNSLWK